MLMLRQINKCLLFAPLESAFIKQHTIIWTSDPKASIVQHTDMIACQKETVHHRHFFVKRIKLYQCKIN